MAAGVEWEREHRVEKVGVFAVHIFSRATRLFEVEQSRTNGRNMVFRSVPLLTSRTNKHSE
jgi:hypothetical protein